MHDLEFPRDSMARLVAGNQESLGIPRQAATFCRVRDPHSPRVCDRYAGHEGPHNDSTMSGAATERTGINQAIEAMKREEEMKDGAGSR